MFQSKYFIKIVIILVIFGMIVLSVYQLLISQSISIAGLDKRENLINYKIIYLTVEGLDHNFYIEHKDDLPNLSEMWSQSLTMPRSMDPVESFYTLATGREQGLLWPVLVGDYQVDWNQTQEFTGQTFWQQVQEKEREVSYNGVNWALETKVRSKEFVVDDILLAARESFVNDRANILETITKDTSDVLVAKINYLLDIGHFLVDNELLEAYKEIDELIGDINNLLGRKELLFVVSPFGQRPIKYLVNINNVLANKGWLKAEGQSYNFGESYAYSIVPGQISLNVINEEIGGVVDILKGQEVADDIAFSIQTIDDLINNRLIDLRIFDTAGIQNRQTDLSVGLPIDYGIDSQIDTDKIRWDIKDNNSMIKNDYLGVDPDLIPGVIFSSKKIDGQVNFMNIYQIMTWLLKI